MATTDTTMTPTTTIATTAGTTNMNGQKNREVQGQRTDYVAVLGAAIDKLKLN